MGVEVAAERVWTAGTRAAAERAPRKTDYRGEDLKHHSLTHTNFSDCDFRRAELDWTSFYRSLLHRANFSSITIQGKEIDLERRAVRVENGDVWDVRQTGSDYVGDCNDNEQYNKEILKGSRRGIVIFHDGRPIGFIKLKGERSFLAVRTVRDENGDVIFWKGMIYALDDKLTQYLVEKSMRFADRSEWRRADIEIAMQEMKDSKKVGADHSFRRNNQRFVCEEKIFERLTRLAERIENGKEKLVDILA
jgi:hypothetical protein